MVGTLVEAIDRFYTAGAFAGALALDHRALKPRNPETQRSYGYTVCPAALVTKVIIDKNKVN